jgi:cysteine desulfurase
LQRIYLDHNATTPVAPEVLEAMLPWHTNHFGNPSSVHAEGRTARVSLDEAREKVATLIGASPGEIVFTSGGTESNNLAIVGAALALQKKGRHIISCGVEHPSVLNPLKQLQGLGFEVEILPVDRLGHVDRERLENAIRDETLLVSIQHANSETGTIQDIENLGRLVQKRGVLFHTDAVQSAGKMVLNAAGLPVDMLSISSHKICGPKGVGALYIKRGGPALFSTQCGGNQEKKRRGGTENVAGIVGFGKASEMARERLGTDVMDRLKQSRDSFLCKIQEKLPWVERFGDPARCLPNTLNLGFAGFSGGTLMIGLDMQGIAVSTGSACSSGSPDPSHVLLAMGVPEGSIESSLRFSLGVGTSKMDLDRVLDVLTRLALQNRKTTSPNSSEF